MAVTSSPAARILQSDSRSAILLKVDGKYVAAGVIKDVPSCSYSKGAASVAY